MRGNTGGTVVVVCFAFEGFTSVPTAHVGDGGRTQSQGNASHTDGVGKGGDRERNSGQS